MQSRPGAPWIGTDAALKRTIQARNQCEVMRKLAIAVAAAVLSHPAVAIYKCTAADGKVVYQDQPCPSANAAASLGPPTNYDSAVQKQAEDRARAAESKAKADADALRMAQQLKEYREDEAKRNVVRDALYKVKAGMTTAEVNKLDPRILDWGEVRVMDYPGGRQVTRTYKDWRITLVIDNDRITFVHR